MNTAEMIAIMASFEDNKNIQMRNVGSDNKNDWEVVMTPSWDWDKYEYRVFIELLDSFFFEFYQDNIWTLTTRRYTKEEFDAVAEENGYTEFSAVRELGIKQVEDTSHLD